jgi:hypothetical protein
MRCAVRQAVSYPRPSATLEEERRREKRKKMMMDLKKENNGWGVWKLDLELEGDNLI